MAQGGWFSGKFTQDLLSLSSIFAFAFGDLDFSIAVAVKSASGNGNILTLSGYDGSTLRLSLVNRKVQVRIGKSSTTSVADVGALSWTYVSVVYTVADRSLRIFVGGVLDTTAAVVMDFQSIAQSAVLSDQDIPFTGWISRFHYFAGAIPHAQVQARLADSGTSLLHVEVRLIL